MVGNRAGALRSCSVLKSEDMSLIPCPGCGKKISDKARMCPNCGHAVVSADRVPEPDPLSVVVPEPVTERTAVLSETGSPPRQTTPPPSVSRGSGVVRFAVIGIAALGGLVAGYFFFRSSGPEITPTEQTSYVAPAPAPDPHAGQHYDPVTQQWSDNRPDDGRYPQTRTRKLVPADVAGLSSAELKIMRNEIFARHGYAFQTADMRDYFGRQPWYTSRSRSVSLSQIEQYNVQFIKRHE